MPPACRREREAKGTLSGTSRRYRTFHIFGVSPSFPEPALTVESPADARHAMLCRCYHTDIADTIRHEDMKPSRAEVYEAR